MKLATALSRRKELQTHIHELENRLMNNAQVQEGEEPAEDPRELLGELAADHQELERLIYSHRMRHVHNTCARWCFGNARCYVDANENKKLVKNRSIGRIDIAVAWVIAMATATVMQGQEHYDKTKLREDWIL